MNAHDKMLAQEKREFIEQRAGYQCEYEDEQQNRCPRKGIECAHLISKSKMNIQKYGKEIVHHPKLMRLSCKEHNDSFNIGFKPAVIQEWIAEVEEEGIENWS